VTPILELEQDFWLVANAEGAAMVAARNDPTGDTLTVLAPLKNVLPFVSPEQRSDWHRQIDMWMRHSENDCLRACGDVRWIAACAALEVTR
jgi:hypothetical protein